MDYKKILKGIVDIINTTEKSDIGFANICSYIGKNCPALKDSEDEMIRKELIKHCRNTRCVTEEGAERIAKWIAWLEKQDKHHIACSEEQIKVLDEVLNFAANHESPYWNNYIFETLNNFIRQLKKLKV